MADRSPSRVVGVYSIWLAPWHLLMVPAVHKGEGLGELRQLW